MGLIIPISEEGKEIGFRGKLLRLSEGHPQLDAIDASGGRAGINCALIGWHAADYDRGLQKCRIFKDLNLNRKILDMDACDLHSMVDRNQDWVKYRTYVLFCQWVGAQSTVTEDRPPRGYRAVRRA